MPIDEIEETEKNEREKKGRSRKQPEEEPFSWRKEIISWTQIIVTAVVIALFLNNIIIANSRVPTGSTENAIMSHSHVIGSRLVYINSEPERRGVVIFKFPDSRKVYYVRRVIGLPGETVNAMNGKVCINGSRTLLDEPYLPEPVEGSYSLYTVSGGYYFITGDSRNSSPDTRFWKNQSAPRKNIMVETLFCYYSKIGRVEQTAG